MNKNDSILSALLYSISLLLLVFGFLLSVKENLSLVLSIINAFIFVASCVFLVIGVKKEKKYLIHTLPILLIFCTTTLSGSILYGSKQYSTDAQSYYEISSQFELMPDIEYLENKGNAEFLSLKRESALKENSATVIIEYDENGYVAEKKKLQSEYGNGDYIDYGVYGKRLDGFEYERYSFIFINRHEPPFPHSVMLIGTNDEEQKIAFVCYRNTTDKNPFFETARRTVIQKTKGEFLEQNCGWRKLK